MSTQSQNNETSNNYSDGSELIPAEVHAREKREGSEPPNEPQAKENGEQPDDKTNGGYTVDRMGLVNNFAITPEMYVEEQ